MAPATVLFPTDTIEDIHDCRQHHQQKKRRQQQEHPAGVFLDERTPFPVNLPVTDAVPSAALAVCLAASRACFAYWRLIFCFCRYRDTAPPSCISGCSSTVLR